jgi:hypothetical protein
MAAPNSKKSLDNSNFNLPETEKIEVLEENMANQNNRLSHLEDCCSNLVDTTQALALQMSAMNDNVNLKFQEMAVTITFIKLFLQIGRVPKFRRTTILSSILILNTLYTPNTTHLSYPLVVFFPVNVYAHKLCNVLAMSSVPVISVSLSKNI